MAFLAAFCMIGLLTMAGPYTAPPPMAMAAIAMATGLDTIAFWPAHVLQLGLS